MVAPLDFFNIPMDQESHKQILFRSVRFWSVICRSDFGVVGVQTIQCTGGGSAYNVVDDAS